MLTQYFWPESFIINDLVRVLAEQGHSVVVATGKPNYPEGRVFDGYQAGGTQIERFYLGVDVVRVPLRPRGASDAVSLFLNYCSFVWSGLRWFPSLLRDYDIDAILVYAVSPVTAAVAALPLKWTKRAHLAIWVQDLWPESLAATGFIRNRVVLAAIGLMVRVIYAFADTLLVQSHAFVLPVSRYADRGKIVYYPNSVALSGCRSDGVRMLPPDLTALLDTHFCVVFAGNIGSAQAVATLVEAASHLRDLPAVRIVIVGSGSMLGWVAQRKAEIGLDNVVLGNRLPVEAMPELYHRAAGLIVSLKNEESLSYTIPSKVQAYLAAGRPIIAAVNGEGARVVAESGAGLTCAAEDSLAVAACVRALYAMPESERARMGTAGRRYFLAHFEMNRQAARLVEILQERAGEKGKRR